MQNVIKKRLFNQRGVTLIELIAVILILGIIAAVGIPSVFNQIKNAEAQADVANVAIMNDAIERYAVMTGNYPIAADFDALCTLLETNANGGPFIKDGFPDTPSDSATDWVLNGSAGAVHAIAAP